MTELKCIPYISALAAIPTSPISGPLRPQSARHAPLLLLSDLFCFAHLVHLRRRSNHFASMTSAQRGPIERKQVEQPG